MQLKHLFYTPEEFVHMDALPVRMGSRKLVGVIADDGYYVGENRHFKKPNGSWKLFRKQHYK